MRDLHDGQVRPTLRCVVESEADTLACACPCRSEVERWLDSPHPVLSVNEVDLGHQARGELDAVTRTSVLTLTGRQARTLYELGSVPVGRWTVRLVSDWPPGARYAADRGPRCAP